jgi:hypothetical protein
MVAARLANLAKGVNKRIRPAGRSSQEDMSQEDAAKKMNVAERTVQRARKVLSGAVPEVVRMVDAGELSLGPAVW